MTFIEQINSDNSEVSKNSQALRFQIIFTYPLKNI